MHISITYESWLGGLQSNRFLKIEHCNNLSSVYSTHHNIWIGKYYLVHTLSMYII